jgi:hypothetical protein
MTDKNTIEINKLRQDLATMKEQVQFLISERRRELSFAGSLSRELVDMGLVPVASMRQSSAQNVSSGAWTKITMDVTLFDLIGGRGVDLVNDRIYARRGGIYLAIGGVQWAASATGTRGAAVYVNGAVAEGSGRYGSAVSTDVVHQPALAIVKVEVNDYFELFGLQVTGGDHLTSVAAPRSFLTVCLLSRPQQVT